jgi:hypothetical protein
MVLLTEQRGVSDWFSEGEEGRAGFTLRVLHGNPVGLWDVPTSDREHERTSQDVKYH